MTVEVPVLGLVLLIFTLHTILTHLLNWAYRRAWKETGGESLLVGLFMVTVAEIVIGISLLNYYIK